MSGGIRQSVKENRGMTRDVETKRKTVHSVAQAFFNRGPDWVTFFREVLGANGVVRTVFDDTKSLADFEFTAEYAAIQQMVVALQEKVERLPPKEAIRVITVRLPQSLHESLAQEARGYGTSVNQLCISKLMQIIDEERIPNNRLKSTKGANAPRDD
jgi:predicted HicB family RNase H-like nuclease